jgi:4'-phosphopantetheinyl transferase
MPADLGWLSPAEAAVAARLRFRKRRAEYLLRRWAGKHAVAAVSGLGSDVDALRRVEIASSADGAPEPSLDGSPWARPLSLTDRAGWAVCVVAGDPGSVGCDLELVEVRSPEFVRDFLTEAEQRYVTTTAQSADVAATLLWSAKESAFKVLRTGLGRDTRSAEVDVAATPSPGGWAPLAVHLAEGGTLPGWWLHEGAFLLTVASDRPLPAPVTLDAGSPLAGAVPDHSWLAEPGG